MHLLNRRARLLTRRRLVALLMLAAGAVHAHGSKAGAVVVDHPYALPSPAGARHAAVYFRALRNTGAAADRLLGASTSAADAVEIHRGKRAADGTLQTRRIEALDLPAGQELRPRHDGDLHLLLIAPKAPLEQGGRFPIRLRFERAGTVEATVWVQQPRQAAAGHAAHGP